MRFLIILQKLRSRLYYDRLGFLYFQSLEYFMKKLALASILISLAIPSLVMARSATKNIQCKGQAEYGELIISDLIITSKNIVLTYIDKTANDKAIVKKYIVTEYMQSNGSTDSHTREAFFIGATASGHKKDYEDIALPHYGMYLMGLGSEIAFNHGNVRVFGTVGCNAF